LKCIALLASGDRAALDVAAAFSLETPHCPPDIAVLIGLMFAPSDRPLPAALADALAAAGAAGSAIAMVYFTSVRQHLPEQARANVMRGLSPM
jgi:hypothetical protein